MELCRECEEDALEAVEFQGYDPVSITGIRVADHVCMNVGVYACLPRVHTRGTPNYHIAKTKIARALAAGYWTHHL